jgi:hypothetical protein
MVVSSCRCGLVLQGYTIPLDKRLAADGRGLQEVSINDNFAKFTEALYIAGGPRVKITRSFMSLSASCPAPSGLCSLRSLPPCHVPGPGEGEDLCLLDVCGHCVGGSGSGTVAVATSSLGCPTWPLVPMLQTAVPSEDGFNLTHPPPKFTRCH